MAVTVAVILDTRREKITTGKFPVQLRVTSNRKAKPYATKFEMTQEEFAKLDAPRVSAQMQEIRESLKNLKRDAENYLDKITDFRFLDFEIGFVNTHPLLKKRKIKIPHHPEPTVDFDFSPYLDKFPILKETNLEKGRILPVYIAYIKRLIQEERLGSAFTYQDSYNALKRFKGNVRFAEITASYLIQFEKFLLHANCTKATVGIKLRPLRAVFNEAIDVHEIITRDQCYPFGKRKYKIPTGRNIKKALEHDHLNKIYNHKPECQDEQMAIDYWLFCYFANGMNPKDVAHLKYKDIHEGFFVFVRAKTENITREDPKPIIVYITEDIKRIIEQYGNTNCHPDNYIFPILQKEFTALDRHFAVKSFIKFINDRMKRIAERLEIPKKVTTVVSRHTLATNLKRAGETTEFIQEALGHTSKQTTENYMDSFENHVKKEFAEKLSLFKNDADACL